MNQNLTVLLVFFITLKVMMDANRWDCVSLSSCIYYQPCLVEMTRSNSKDVDISLFDGRRWLDPCAETAVQ